MDSEKKVAKERARGETCWVGYISPLTVIVPKGEDPLAFDLDETNNNSYNHGRLCGIVHAIDFGHRDGLKMLICRDGAIGIPWTNQHGKKEDAVNFFNRLFCQLLISGHLCEAVDTRDIVTGRLHEASMIWPVDFGESSSSLLHERLRMRLAGTMETIMLTSPKHLSLQNLVDHLRKGNDILSFIPNLTPGFLLSGVTELTYHNWTAALSHLWITAEQLTDFIWRHQFLDQPQFGIAELPGRVKAMRDDNRTWSVAVKLEILHTSGVISKQVFGQLYPSRQARNKLVHEGQGVSEEIVLGLYAAVCSLLEQASGESGLLVPASQLKHPFRERMDQSQPKPNSHEQWKEIQISGL